MRIPGHRTLLSIALLASAGIGNAASISGYVVDAASREPLPVAAVTIPGTDRGVSTNLDGYFVLDFLKPGGYTLEASYVGYKSLRTEALASDEIAAPVTLKLQREAVRLEAAEVTVSAERDKEKRLHPQVSTVPVEGRLVRTMPSLMGEMDVLRALQTIPGVKASSDLSSALHVRGGSTDQTLILMDHTTVYNPSHMFGLFSTFNADAVKHIELMKGGFPAYYGGRSGSVLEVITNEGNRRETRGLFSLGIISARGSLEGPLPNKRGSWAASLRRTYMDLVVAAIRSTSDIELPDYYFYDANGKLNLDLDPRTTLTLAGYGGDDRMDVEAGPDDSRLQIRMDWGNRTFSARLRHALGRRAFFSVAGTFSRYHSLWRFSNDAVLLDLGRDHLDDRSLQGDIELFHGAHRIKAGMLGTRYGVLYREESEDLTWVDVDESGYSSSAYIQDQWRVTPLWEVQAGLRGYYHDVGGQTALDPRLALVYHWSPDVRFKAAVGRYSQFLNLITAGEILTSFDLWIPIDETLKPSYSDQLVLGFEYDRLDGLELTTEVYYTDMNRIATLDPQADEGHNAEDAFLVGEGYASGAEWMLRRTRGRLSGWLGYSLSWTRRRFPGSPINDGDWFYPRWDRRHDFIVVADYTLSRAWGIAGTWRYNTGQGYTQAVGVTRYRWAGVGEDYTGVRGRASVWGGYNNYRFPADHRLDVTLTYKHLFFKLPAKLNISVTNVYSRRSYWRRSFSYQEDPVEITDIKLLPVIPMVSYEVRF